MERHLTATLRPYLIYEYGRRANKPIHGANVDTGPLEPSAHVKQEPSTPTSTSKSTVATTARADQAFLNAQRSRVHDLDTKMTEIRRLLSDPLPEDELTDLMGQLNQKNIMLESIKTSMQQFQKSIVTRQEIDGLLQLDSIDDQPTTSPTTTTMISHHIDMTHATAAEEKESADDIAYNDLTLQVILEHLDENIRTQYEINKDIKIASHLWASLEQDYGTITETEKRTIQQQLFMTTMKEKETVQEFAARLETMFVRVADVQERPLNDGDKMMHLIRAMQPVKRFAQALENLTLNDQGNYREAIKYLRTAEAYRQSFTHQVHIQERDGQVHAVTKERPLSCYKCGKPGHFARNCGEKKLDENKDDKDDKNKKWNKKKESRNLYCKHHKSHTHNTVDCKFLKNMDKDKAKAYLAKLEKDTEEPETTEEEGESGYHVQREDDDSDPTVDWGHAYMTMSCIKDALSAQSQVTCDDDWIIDSGASDHITGKETWMKNMKTHDKNWRLRTAGNQIITVNKTGHVDIQMNNNMDTFTHALPLNKVSHAPGMRTNLISVARLVDDGFEVTFTKTEVNIIHIQRGINITVPRIGNLYIIKTQSHIGNSDKHSATTVDVDAHATSLIGTSPKPTMSAAATAAAIAKVTLWHRRWGHGSVKRLAQLKKYQAVVGYELLPTHAEIAAAAAAATSCVPCSVAKASRLPFNNGRSEFASYPLDRTHADICGPVTTYRDMHGRDITCTRYTSAVVDEASRCIHLDIIKTKGATAVAAVKWIKQAQTQTGRKLKIFHSDLGSEYKANVLQDYLADNGTRWTTSLPHTPQQNGIAERCHRTLFEAVRSMLHEAQLPKGYWEWAILAAVYLHNRSITSGTGDDKRTPYEIYHGRKPNIANIRVWGCDCYVYQLPKELRQTGVEKGQMKLTNRGVPCIFIGYEVDHSGYRVYDPYLKTIFSSRNVIFYENEFTIGERVKNGKLEDYNDIQWTDISNPPVPMETNNHLQNDEQEGEQKQNQPIQEEKESPSQETHEDVVTPTKTPVPDHASVKEQQEHVHEFQHEHKHPLQQHEHGHELKQPLTSQEDKPVEETKDREEVKMPTMQYPLAETRHEDENKREHEHKHTSSTIAPETKEMTTDTTPHTIRIALPEHPKTHTIISPIPQPQFTSPTQSSMARTSSITTPQIAPRTHKQQQHTKHLLSKIGTTLINTLPVGPRRPPHVPGSYDHWKEGGAGALMMTRWIDDEERMQDSILDPFAFLLSQSEPTTYTQAVGGNEYKHWKHAMDAEMQSLHENVTWKLVPLPPGRKACGSKWVFKYKVDKDGNIDRYKARLCAKGFTQQAGIDYNETFAPVLRYQTLRILLVISALRDYEIDQLDVTTAFLNATLKEEVYMEQPQGYEQYRKDGVRLVCLLLKAIYGTKQAPLEWNAHLNEVLISLGYKRCLMDTCLYVKISRTGRPMYIGVFVDDLIPCYHPKDKKEWEHDKSQLKIKYKMTDKGSCEWVLGMRITRNRTQRTLILDQSKYIETLIHRHDMQNARVAVTPEEVSPSTIGKKAKQTSVGEQHILDEQNTSLFRSIVGGVMYASISTRPDITHAVRGTARHMQKPTTTDLSAGKRMLQYLKGTQDIGLTFRPKNGKDRCEPDGSVEITAFSDADWGGDEETGQSTSGYIVAIDGNIVCWDSKRQHGRVAQSTAESEYYAVCSAANTVTWVKSLLNEMHVTYGRDYPTTINTDNQAAIHICEKDVLHARTKHIHIKYHFIRQEVAQKRIQMRYINTKEQPADILTKALHGPTFRTLREMITPHCPAMNE